MRPLILKMCAFGPYKNEIEIDFNDFKGSLFLINGPTGSGKTTIFDGISYALYGETSGDARRKLNPRSNFADKDVETYVELTFEYKGNEYHVIRKPEQLRKSKKTNADGTVDYVMQKSSIWMKCPDGELEGNKANERIIKIIGLNRDEFKQTIMIAQGDFRDLVDAKTESRIEIFRKIFNTYPIHGFIRNLEEETSSLAGKLHDSKLHILDRFKEFEGVSNSLKPMLNDISYLDQIINTMDEIIKVDRSIKQEKDNEISKYDEIYRIKLNIQKDASANNDKINRYKKTLKDVDNLELQRPVYNEKKKIETKIKAATYCKGKYDSFIDVTKTLAESKINKENLINQLPELEQQQEFSSIAFVRVNELEKARNEAQSKKLAIQSKIDNFTKLEQAQDQLKTSSRKYEDFSLIVNQESKIVNDLKGKIDAFEKNGAYNHFAEKQKELSNIERLEYEKNALSMLTGKIEKVESLQKQYDLNYSNLKLIEEESNKANNRYRLETDNLLASQASVLASKLIEGHKCPVCGSTHHPSPAKSNYHVLSDDELKELSKVAKEKTDLYENKKAELQEMMSDLSSTKNHVVELYNERFSNILDFDVISKQIG